MSWFLRLRLDILDRDGAPAKLFFHCPDRGGAIAEELKIGYTVAVFYATESVFPDGDTGVRVESPRAVKVCNSHCRFCRRVANVNHTGAAVFYSTVDDRE